MFVEVQVVGGQEDGRVMRVAHDAVLPERIFFRSKTGEGPRYAYVLARPEGSEPRYEFAGREVAQ